MKAQLEEHIKTALRLTHKIIPWLVPYSSFLLSRYLVHEDGHTSYFRRWGRNFAGALCHFCERIMYLVPRRTQVNKFGPKFEPGIYLGKDAETGETWVGTETGQSIRVRTCL